MDWEFAKKRLDELKSYYEKKGYRHTIIMALIIDPLLQRYESGERTIDLYNKILLFP